MAQVPDGPVSDGPVSDGPVPDGPVSDGPAPGLVSDGPVSDDPASCATCGTTADVRPPTWSLQVGPRGATWLCDACTRRDLRSIEGRLDEAWW